MTLEQTRRLCRALGLLGAAVIASAVAIFGWPFFWYLATFLAGAWLGYWIANGRSIFEDDY